MLGAQIFLGSGFIARSSVGSLIAPSTFHRSIRLSSHRGTLCHSGLAVSLLRSGSISRTRWRHPANAGLGFCAGGSFAL